MRSSLALSALAFTLAMPLGAEAARVFAVVQKERAFAVSEIDINQGDTIRFTNEDSFLHQIFVKSPSFSIDSGEQRPGQDVDVQFPVIGSFHVLCFIHPKMNLKVNVR